MVLNITSIVFANKDIIPVHYTCSGADVSLPLQWLDIFHGTKSLALTLEEEGTTDPETPYLNWVHWILYNLPARYQNSPEDIQSCSLPEDRFNIVDSGKSNQAPINADATAAYSATSRFNRRISMEHMILWGIGKSILRYIVIHIKK